VKEGHSDIAMCLPILIKEIKLKCDIFKATLLRIMDTMVTLYLSPSSSVLIIPIFLWHPRVHYNGKRSAICSHNNPDHFSPHPPTTIFSLLFNFKLNFNFVHVYLMCATCPAHHILIDFTTLVISGKENKQRRKGKVN
jgi:hypothetical protein